VSYFLGALLGGFAGYGLYHAAFGFTGAWRRMSRERRGAGLRAQMVLIGLTCVVTYLLIGYQDVTGWTMYPVIMPMGLMTAIGAFMFGVGMQIGGGCASGTLFTVGGGSTRMAVTLAFFVLGSVWATVHLVEFWARLPQITGIPNIPGTSLMNFGIVFGAMAAASMAGRFSPQWRLSARDILTAAIGGLLMGYGARLAYGCNIGAFLGGVVSGSMHGWWWLVWGFSGSLLGTRLRTMLEMDPPLPPRRATIRT